MPFARRLLYTALLAAAMFVSGTIVYFACRGFTAGATKEFWTAVAWLPLGFAPDYRDGTASVVLGWLFYAGCYLVLLVSRRTRVYWSTSVVLLVAYCFNLSGCVHVLTS